MGSRGVWRRAHQQHGVPAQLQRAQADQRGPLVWHGVQADRPGAHVLLARDAELLQLRQNRYCYACACQGGRRRARHQPELG